MSNFESINEMFKLLAQEPQPEEEERTNDSKRHDADPCDGDGHGGPIILEEK